MPNGSCHGCHHTALFSNWVNHLNCHNDQLNVSFPSPKPQSLNFVQNIPTPIWIMLRLINKFMIVISNVPLTVLGYCYAIFQSRVRMIGCRRLSTRSRNIHHGFLSHVLISQLAKFRFIAGFQHLPADVRHFEF